MNWRHDAIYNKLIKFGLTDSEARYVVNKISNEIRQCGDTDTCNNFRISVNGENDEEYNEILESGCCSFADVELKLKSGKVVEFGFNYNH